MLLFFIALYLLASVICFIMVAIDKRAAQAGRRRISERALLWASAAGGWPGGYLAQRSLRHKTDKPSFRWRFRAAIVLNVLMVAALVYVALYVNANFAA